jgi:hypothetical protein
MSFLINSVDDDDALGTPYMKVYEDTAGKYTNFEELRRNVRNQAHRKLTTLDPSVRTTLAEFVTDVNGWEPTGDPEPGEDRDQWRKDQFVQYLDSKWMTDATFLNAVHRLSYDLCPDPSIACEQPYPDFLEDILVDYIGVEDYIYNHPSYMSFRNQVMSDSEDDTTEKPEGNKHMPTWIVYALIGLVVVLFGVFFVLKKMKVM